MQLVAVKHDPFSGGGAPPAVAPPPAAAADDPTARGWQALPSGGFARQIPGRPLEISMGPPPPDPPGAGGAAPATSSAAPAAAPPAQGPRLVPVKHDPFSALADEENFKPAPSPPALQDAMKVKAAEANPTGTAADPAMQGLTLGFSDEIGGLLEGLSTKLKGGEFGEGYTRGRKRILSDLENYRTRHPVASTVAEIVGSIPASLLPIGTVAKGATLAAKILAGVKGGAALGGVYGAGSSDGDLVERGAGAASGVVSGGALGLVAPIVAKGVSIVAKPVVEAVTARINPRGFAATKIAEREASSGGVERAAQRIERANADGQRATLLDVGSRGTQRLARTVANMPGTAGDRIVTRTNLSALSQSERLKRLVGETFNAPEGTYQAAKNVVMDARARAAKPQYDLAYSRPIPYTHELEAVLATPAGRAALAAAKKNSLNLREPWAQWFASVDDAGNLISRERVPDTEALDEVQRVLRRASEDARAPADGSPFAKPKSTPESNAIGRVRSDLLREMDRANPAFAKARAIALDNIEADEALEFGRTALETDARIVAQKMGSPTAYGKEKVFSEGQKELARIGLAEALFQKLTPARGGDTGNLLTRFGPALRAKVRPFFATEGEYNIFARKIILEVRKAKGVANIRGNSTTAAQLADMADAGQLRDTVHVGARLAEGKIVAASVAALSRIIHRLGGLTPKVANEIATLILSSDPNAVRAILARIRSIETSKASAEVRRNQIRALLTQFSGGQVGRAIGSQLEAPADAR